MEIQQHFVVALKVAMQNGRITSLFEENICIPEFEKIRKYI